MIIMFFIVIPPLPVNRAGVSEFANIERVAAPTF
jgi:hypothetical protein